MTKKDVTNAWIPLVVPRRRPVRGIAGKVYTGKVYTGKDTGKVYTGKVYIGKVYTGKVYTGRPAI